MNQMLRGGLGDAPLVSYKALIEYQQNQSREQHPEPKTRRPKTRRAMKAKIVRGKKGAMLRGGYTTPSGRVRGGLIRVPDVNAYVIESE